MDCSLTDSYVHGIFQARVLESGAIAFSTGGSEPSLNERERQIIVLRYGLFSKAYTQREIAKKLKISRSYVSRIEKKALSKMYKYFKLNEGIK